MTPSNRTQVYKGRSFAPLRRTVLCVTPYFPPHGGGLEQYARAIAERLHREHGWRIVIVTSGTKGGIESKVTTDDYTIYRLPYQFKISNTPFSFIWYKSLRRIIEKEKPDVINVHTPVPGIGDVASFLARTRPLVVTYHAGSMRKGRTFVDTLIALYERFPMRFMLRRADHIICSSDMVRLDFLRDFTGKSTTISPGVDSNRFFPNASRRSSSPSLLFVAGLARSEQHKGLHTLIDAFAILRKKHPELRLTVVGDGDMRSEYEQIVTKQGLRDAIVFKGRLDGDSLVRAYQEAHLFVHPTRNDSSPLVIMEAMASGLPVVSTRVGSIPTIVGNSGSIVQPNDSQALAKEIDTILTGTKRADVMRTSAREKAVREFDWKPRTQAYSDILTESLQANEPIIVQITGYYPPHHGGIERVAHSLARRLAESGRNIRVLTSSQGSVSHGIEQEKNLTVKRLASFEFAHTPFAPALPWHLFRLPRKSIIHLHLSQAYWPELVMIIAKLRRIPYLVHFHLDVRPSGSLGMLFTLYKKILWGPILRNATKVVVCSREQIPLVAKKYSVPENRIVYIPNGVDDEFLAQKPHSFDGPLKLLFVGRLAPQKRVERLVEAMTLVKSQAHLTIIGDGEERASLEARAAELNLSNITFTGAKGHEDIKHAFEQHDALLISSEHEGMPLVVLEAMAAGLPIVGSNVLGIRELVENVGTLVDEPFAQEFARTIDALATNSARLTEMSQASSTAAQKYTWPRIIEQFDTLYRSIV